LGRAEKFDDTVSAIGAFLRIDTGLFITFDDGPFGTLIDTATAVDAIFVNFISHDSSFSWFKTATKIGSR